MGQVGSLMKVGDLIRNKKPGTTPAYITGMIVEIFPNGSTLYPGMLAKLLWFGGNRPWNSWVIWRVTLRSSHVKIVHSKWYRLDMDKRHGGDE